jgi:1-phosphatidylinositol-3-phosphate 5-kinase
MDIKEQSSLPRPFFSETSFKIARQSLSSQELDASNAHVFELNNTESIAEIDLRSHSRESYREPIYESEEPGSCTSSLSDQIDLAWTGSSWTELKMGLVSPVRKAITPVRVHSFNSSLGLRQRVFGGPTTDLLNSVPVKFGDFPNMKRAISHRILGELENSTISMTHSPFYLTSLSNLRADRARLLLPQAWYSDVAVAVYDDDPTSIISLALTLAPVEAGETHVRVLFEDENALPGDKAKFSVTCYYAKQFEKLRGKCCEAELNFVRSLCRCKRWNAKGGKSNVYFAKTLDERFVVKQVTKTELESFEEFAPEYFKYVNGSLVSGSPTCLAKVLGIYQVKPLV